MSMPNDDLISRKLALESICFAIGMFHDADLLRKTISMLPAADAPVVHSTYHLHHREDFSAPPCECNNCHCEFTVDDVKEDCHYCPKCGAKLDGEEPACGPDYCEIGGVDDEK